MGFLPVGLRITFALKNSSKLTDLFEDCYSVAAAVRIQKKNKNFELQTFYIKIRNDSPPKILHICLINILHHSYFSHWKKIKRKQIFQICKLPCPLINPQTIGRYRVTDSNSFRNPKQCCNKGLKTDQPVHKPFS